jgi:Na+/H+ antiporter NhaD/arsenite permease-like protein
MMMLIVGNLHLVGFFEWSVEFVLRRLKPAHLLPAVVFASGVFSAFFVNDIVCLVMVPFVLTITRRVRLAPLPYLLAVATGSNVGSVATITGNPQNMLIGSFSGISYRDFFFHLGPVGLVGLFLNWAVVLLKSLVPGFTDPHTAWLALAMASTLAGNLTITGSVANIIVVESVKPDVHIGFWDYFCAGFPITLLTILFGLAWLALVR